MGDEALPVAVQTANSISFSVPFLGGESHDLPYGCAGTLLVLSDRCSICCQWEAGEKTALFSLWAYIFWAVGEQEVPKQPVAGCVLSVGVGGFCCCPLDTGQPPPVLYVWSPFITLYLYGQTMQGFGRAWVFWFFFYLFLSTVQSPPGHCPILSSAEAQTLLFIQAQ